MNFKFKYSNACDSIGQKGEKGIECCPQNYHSYWFITHVKDH